MIVIDEYLHIFTTLKIMYLEHLLFLHYRVIHL